MSFFSVLSLTALTSGLTAVAAGIVFSAEIIVSGPSFFEVSDALIEFVSVRAASTVGSGSAFTVLVFSLLLASDTFGFSTFVLPLACWLMTCRGSVMLTAALVSVSCFCSITGSACLVPNAIVSPAFFLLTCCFARYIFVRYIPAIPKAINKTARPETVITFLLIVSF